MKKRLNATILSGGLIVLGIITLFTPYLIAPVCNHFVELKSGMMTFMRCHYTAQAAILLGSLIIISGLLLLMRKGGTFHGGLMAAVLGITLMIVPQSWMIGVCRSSEMPCITTKTFLMVEGAVVFLIGIMIVLAERHKERA